jgi:predicted outer membrane repeat protein
MQTVPVPGAKLRCEQVHMKSSSFSRNRGAAGGGAIFLVGALTIEDSLFDSNEASPPLRVPERMLSEP